MSENHTPFVVSARYSKPVKDKVTGETMSTLLGTLMGAKRLHNGRLEGLMWTSEMGMERVESESASLDLWTLEAEPVEREVLDALHEAIHELRNELAIQRGGFGEVNAVSDLKAMNKRGKNAASGNV